MTHAFYLTVIAALLFFSYGKCQEVTGYKMALTESTETIQTLTNVQSNLRSLIGQL